MTIQIAGLTCLYRSLCLLLMAAAFTSVAGQVPAQPGREQLLNGLTVLYWQRLGDPNILLKLRVRSGAAFDLAGKGGMMALLGDALFPDASTREYVTEQLGGKLEVVTDFDGINVTISGKSSDIERMVDLLRGALLNVQLSAENVTKLRDARVKALSAQPMTVSEIADQAITARLFGNFPYGHPPTGTPESLAKVERADLMLARERFLNADNATLVAIGGVDQAHLMRTLRQLLGPWQKGDRVVPATFRQPNPPDRKVLAINQKDSQTAEIRLALRGLARSDPDAQNADALAEIVRARWSAAFPVMKSVSVRHLARGLPGIFVLGASVPSSTASAAIDAADKVLSELVQNGPSAAEIEQAKSVLTGTGSGSSPDLIADRWLDADEFKLSSSGNSKNSAPGDFQRLAARLFQKGSVAKVVVGDTESLKASFGENLEVAGGKPEAKSSPNPSNPVRKP